MLYVVIALSLYIMYIESIWKSHTTCDLVVCFARRRAPPILAVVWLPFLTFTPPPLTISWTTPSTTHSFPEDSPYPMNQISTSIIKHQAHFAPSPIFVTRSMWAFIWSTCTYWQYPSCHLICVHKLSGTVPLVSTFHLFFKSFYNAQVNITFKLSYMYMTLYKIMRINTVL